MDYIPKSCEWPDCAEPIRKHKSYCPTHYSRVYRTVDELAETKEFKKLFSESKKLNFKDQLDDQELEDEIDS